MTDTETLRRALVDDLTAAGAIRTAPWRDAFASVPREQFARRFWHHPTPMTRHFVDGTDPAQRDTWLSIVYSDDALVTQDGRAGQATSSSTQPSLMALMLEALDARPGMRTLEIGTGTGYNAALLCHRLGDEQVTTIEIDPELTEAARDALTDAGYTPAVVCGDGLNGFAPGAPYDRIIATCSTMTVPAAWLEQATPGGVILVNLGYGVARLAVDDHHTAQGRFLPEFGAFIEARAADGSRRLTAAETIELCASDGVAQAATINGDDYESEEFGFLVRLLLPDLTPVGRTDDDSPVREYLYADARTRSWAVLAYDPAGDSHVTQGGKLRLFDELEDIRRRWTAAGRPVHSRIGVTIHDQVARLWVDDPHHQLATLTA